MKQNRRKQGKLFKLLLKDKEKSSKTILNIGSKKIIKEEEKLIKLKKIIKKLKNNTKWNKINLGEKYWN